MLYKFLPSRNIIQYESTVLYNVFVISENFPVEFTQVGIFSLCVQFFVILIRRREDLRKVIWEKWFPGEVVILLSSIFGNVPGQYFYENSRFFKSYLEFLTQKPYIFTSSSSNYAYIKHLSDSEVSQYIYKLIQTYTRLYDTWKSARCWHKREKRKTL